MRRIEEIGERIRGGDAVVLTAADLKKRAARGSG